MPESAVAGTTERQVHLPEVDLHVIEAGSGPPVVLAHGFPELGYSWRHQIPTLAEAGYHVVAPDQRGYGRSGAPGMMTDYDITHLVGDLLGLLDGMGEERAVFVGHDWGSMVVWQLALLAPERVRAVVGMSVPFTPRSPMPPLQAMRAIFGDNFFYMLYFQEPGVADADLGADAARTMRGMLAGLSEGGAGAGAGAGGAEDRRGFVERLAQPEKLPAWLTQEELDHYTAEFGRTGFTGGINWYRNLDRNWELTGQLDGAKVTVPSLFIGGGSDPVLMMMPPAVMEGWVSDHRGNVIIEGAGHWVQQEKPDAVNTALLEFLAQL
jgi:pimeloyl-ACP methyl ester carboxylesterase